MEKKKDLDLENKKEVFTYLYGKFLLLETWLERLIQDAYKNRGVHKYVILTLFADAPRSHSGFFIAHFDDDTLDEFKAHMQRDMYEDAVVRNNPWIPLAIVSIDELKDIGTACNEIIDEFYEDWVDEAAVRILRDLAQPSK